MKKCRTTLIPLALAAVFFLAGCAGTAPYTTHSSLKEKAGGIKTIYLMPVVSQVSEVSAGGVSETNDEWSSTALVNFLKALEYEVGGRAGVELKPLTHEVIPPGTGENLDETMALFDAVGLSIVVHTYGMPINRLPGSPEDFDFTLGEEVRGLSKDADSYLVLRVFAQVPTLGRRVEAAVVGLIPAVSGVHAAIIDPDTGRVLWFNSRSWTGTQYDVRDPESVKMLVIELFKGLPVGAGAEAEAGDGEGGGGA